MRHPKVFTLLLFIGSFLLLLMVFPAAIRISTSRIPFFNRVLPKTVSFDPSYVNIDLGVIRIKREFSYKLGLDLQGGTRIVYTVDMSDIPTEQRGDALDSARNVIEKRINFFGVSEPSLQTIKVKEEYRVIVELPGIEDVSSAIDVIGKTAQLTFWEEGENATPSASALASLPPGITMVLGENPKKTNLTGKDLNSAKVVFDPSTGTPQVQLDFNQEGTKRFAEITKRNVQKRLAIVLDDQVVTAPVVNEPILSGNSVISGGPQGFPLQEAKGYAIALNAGALPAPLKIISQNTVGPSLGLTSLKKSLVGGFLGFLSIVAFMSFLYKREGVLACLALFVYTTIVLFIFKLIPVTLTLAGIAGFILSVGMAVDANILIFERMKEELRAGKAHDIALPTGFNRAWSSIRDSNISSLITCAILFYLGSGIVRGFALTLAIGILISMFSAIVVTRNLLKVFSK